MRFEVVLVEVFFHEGFFEAKTQYRHPKCKGAVCLKQGRHLLVVGFDVFDGVVEKITWPSCVRYC